MRVETTSNLSCFPERTLLKDFEGGAVYLAREKDDWLVITDETAMLSMLDEEDAEGLNPIKVYRFTREKDRNDYLVARGWMKEHP